MNINKFTAKEFKCQVCLQETNQVPAKTFCFRHPHLCESCYHGHINSQISTSMNEISCPFENCEEKLEESSAYFLELPAQMRSKYSNILRNLKDVKEKVRFCPTCNERLVKDTDSENLICGKCKKKLCKECLSLAHEFRGNCEINVLFQLKCQFRQCPNCRFLVQKSKGCDHMPCICGHHFCYVCGKNRSSYNDHKCENRERKRSL